MASFRYKLTIAGNVLTERIYEKHQYAGYEAAARKPKRELSEDERRENARRSALRAKKALIEAVNSNFGWVRRGFRYGEKSVKFLTLTYRENMTDYDRLTGDFDRFRKRVEYHLREKIQYVCVPECQQRGAYHLHVLLFCSFLPLDTLKRLWNEAQGQGSFDVKRVQYVHNIGKYIGKYIGKDFETEAVGPGKKRFWCSHGMTKRASCFRFADKPEIDALAVFQKRKTVASCYESEYEGELTGKVKFRQFVLFPSEANCRLVGNLIEIMSWEQKETDPCFVRLCDQARFAALPHAIQRMRRKQQQIGLAVS